MARAHGYPDRSGINRYGEEHIRPGSFEGLDHSVAWSSDPRSEASGEKHHHGKGPRNFSRTDDLLREEVCEALLRSPELDAGNIEVDVKDALVTLKGHVRFRDDRYLAEDMARDVIGVKDVENRISRGKWDAGDDPGGLIKGMR